MKLPLDSAIKHVTGESVYINDMPVNDRLLTGRVVYSSQAHARIISVDISKAKKVSGVHSILTFNDIPGINQMGAVINDEPCLAENEVFFIGQVICLIAAESEEIAIAAEKLITIKYQPLEAILTIEQAMEKNSLIAPPHIMETGMPDKALAEAEYKIDGTLLTGAQEHWYLETQTCLCIPGEGNEMSVYSSTQHPSETQAIVAQVLGIQRNEVVVEVRRMGGAFGGKETQGNHTAAWTALLANATRRPVKIHLFREDDQRITGKRHRFLSKYKAGFDKDGKITACIMELNADAGAATDLSMAILDRALFHADNAYFIPNFRAAGKAWKTNLPSNTAFRGFGGPQGIAVIETIIDRIARYLKKDAAEIRFKNFYGLADQNITHYGEKVENNHLNHIYEKLISSSDYYNRRKALNEFNAINHFYKKGLAITPVKFGISFTTSFLNQAGALVNIYTDGTVLVNHGGTEMGQGLHTKIQGIVASELGINPDFVKINATNTSKIPNTSATAASSGSDLNGMAVKNATDKLKKRLADVAVTLFNKNADTVFSSSENILFNDNKVVDSRDTNRSVSFKELLKIAYLQKVNLSAKGFYATPDIFFDQTTGKGHPFHYYVFGMAVSEVLLDVLTGEHKLMRTDILHDVGNSLNEGIDIGQIEGGFIQGVGWCTTEELKWDAKGNVLNVSPDTYKIPTINDIPLDFRVELLHEAPNPITIQNSKAVGEPPFMLAFSVWLAIKDAVSATGDHRSEPDVPIPATNENILLAIEKIKNR
jgi:xanthine dehydrogenase molybdopterin binding subunit